MNNILTYLKNYPIKDNIINNQDATIHSLVEEALSIATFYYENKQQIIIVKDSTYDAELLYDNLSTLSDDVYLYLSDESKRLESIAFSNEFLESRLIVLNKLINQEKIIVITNTPGFLRYLPNPEVFIDNTLKFKVNSKVDYNSLKSRLISAGYKFSKRVDQPLTFSMRGEIVDIFSINYDNPIRIQFFDDEIELIRFFDIQSQLTTESVESVEIVVGSDILFSESQKLEIYNKLEKILEKERQHLYYSTLHDKIRRDIDYLKNNISINEFYNYYGLVSDEYSILDYTFNAKIIYSEKSLILNSENLITIDTIDYVKELYDSGKMALILDLWLNASQLFAKYKHINFSKIVGKAVNYTPIVKIDVPIKEFDYVIVDLIKKSENNCVILSLSKGEEKLVKKYFDENDVTYKPFSTVNNGIYFSNQKINEGFNYQDLYLYTSAEVFNKKSVSTKYSSKFNQGVILDDYQELEKGDYVVHNLYGVGRYVEIVTREVNGKKRDFLKILYRDNDTLFVPLHQFKLVRKFVSSEGVAIKLNKLGSDEWNKTKEKVAENVAKLAKRLVYLYGVRKEKIGFKFEEDVKVQQEFNNEVSFDLTLDQKQSINEIFSDMKSNAVMDRLLIGDVGFGKTEVAMRAAFMAAYNGKQVGFLCPTTILSNQHFKTFISRFKNFPINIKVINRFISTKDQKVILKDLSEGKIDILIATHRMLSKDVKFKDLGLLIIDEEQRFGVEHKEIIKEYKENVDVLSLSATPIPRTLQMSLIGVRAMSTLNQPPKHRKPIQTYVIEKNINTINHVIKRELARGGQVYYLHNNVSNLSNIALRLKQDIENISVGIVSGQMDKDSIEDVMNKFTNKEYDVLVCTSIIETGIDIANVNTILIDNADHFGLSQLYQIRGRVGRSDKIAYAYLMYQPNKVLSEVQSKRLSAIKEFTQLGSGQKIALRDLTIRGAGDMLGDKQSGFIDTVGIDMYIEMLEKAVLKQQGIEVSEEVDESIQIIDSNGHIPKYFTSFDDDKITLYKEIDQVENKSDLDKLYEEVANYYGKLPEDINALFEKKYLEILLENKNIVRYQELLTRSEITFSKEFSDNIDGVFLFEMISNLKTKVKLDYKYKQITLKIVRGEVWISDIIMVLTALFTEVKQ